MGKKVKKSTKNFIKKGNLPSEIKRRKHRQNVRDGKLLAENKKTLSKLSKNAEEAAQRRAQKQAAEEQLAADQRHLSDMGADQFLNTGFLDQLGDDDEGDEETHAYDRDDLDAIPAAGARKAAAKQKGRVALGVAATETTTSKPPSAAARHRQELEELRQRDPDFFEFLQQEDAGLLEFDELEEDEPEDGGHDDDDDDDDVDDDEDALPGDGGEDGDQGESAVGQGGLLSDGRKPVTMRQIVQWSEAALEGSLVAASHLTQAFRAACHINDIVADDAFEQERRGDLSDKRRNTELKMSAAAALTDDSLPSGPSAAGKRKRSGSSWNSELGSSTVRIGGGSRDAGRYAIQSGDVFDAVMVACFTAGRRIFDRLAVEGMSKRSQKKQQWKDLRRKAKQHRVGDDQAVSLGGVLATAQDGSGGAGSGADDGTALPRRSTLDGWAALRPLARSYTASLVHFLQTCANDEMRATACGHIEAMSPFFEANTATAKAAVRALLAVWSDAGDGGGGARDADGDGAAAAAAAAAASRVQAFMAISAMARAMPAPFDEWCLKNAYLCFLRNAKFSSPATASLLQFMENGVVELLRAAPQPTAYSVAFVYVRQLAVHLRSALVLKTKESRQSVLSWTFVRALRVWCRAVGQLADLQQLRPLVFPVVQTALGTVRVGESARHFPLRLHVCRMLAGLARDAGGGLFVNLSGLLLTMLDWSELTKRTAGGGARARPGASTSADLDFALALRAPKAQLASVRFQTRLLEHVSEVAVQFFAVYARSIAFPELAVPVVAAVRRAKKAVNLPQHRRILIELAASLESNSNFIKQQRANVDFAPSDANRVREWQLNLPSTPLEKEWQLLEQSLALQRDALAAGDHDAGRKRKQLHQQQPEAQGSRKKKQARRSDAMASPLNKRDARFVSDVAKEAAAAAAAAASRKRTPTGETKKSTRKATKASKKPPSKSVQDGDQVEEFSDYKALFA